MQVGFFPACDENLCGDTVLSKNSIFSTPKWHFSTVSFNPAPRMHLKTALLFRVIFVALLAALPLLSSCEKFLLGLRQLECWNDKQRIPIQDGDQFGNDPQLVPGFVSQCSEMFPECFRRLSVSVGTKEICRIWTEHPKCGTLSF